MSRRLLKAFALALALPALGSAIVRADSYRIPGDYDPTTKTFRLYPRPAAVPAASVSLYTGTVKITISIGTTIPKGTAINYNVAAYIADPDLAAGAGFEDTVTGTITATGGTSTGTFTVPYYTLISDTKDQLVVNLSASADYTDSNGVVRQPSGIGTTTVALPKNGATTAVTVAAGL